MASRKRLPRNATERSEALYSACRGERWEAALALCRCEGTSEGTANLKAPFKVQDEYGGRTCLHEAVEKNAPCRVVRAILDAHKQCSDPITRIKDKLEQTALHTLADRFKRSQNDAAVVAVLEVLAESDPHCATMHDRHGRTPLHLIVTVSYPENDEQSAIRVACVRALLNASTPKTILSPDKSRCTALHVACYHWRGTPEIVKTILKHCPQAALTKDKKGNTPLHYVVARSGLNVDFNHAKIALLLESLTMLSQSGASAVNKYRQTPLHFAVYGADKTAIKLLLDSLPKSVYIKDKSGMILLDCVQESFAEAVWNPWHEQGMSVCSRPEFRFHFKDMCEKCNLLAKTMLHIQTKSKRHGSVNLMGEKSLWTTTEQKSRTGEESLELALIHNYLRLGSDCPLHFFQVLKGLHPHQTEMKDARGDLPLHIALENGVQHAKLRTYHSHKTFSVSRNSLIEELIDAYPQAAREPNRNGDLPFHILLQNRDGEIGWCCSVQPILRAHPAALWHEKTNALFVLLPLILAKLGDDDDVSILYGIVREMPLLCFGVIETTTIVSQHMCDVQALRIE